MAGYNVIFFTSKRKLSTECFTTSAKTLDEAKSKLEAIKDYSIYLYEKNIMHNHSLFGYIMSIPEREQYENHNRTR